LESELFGHEKGSFTGAVNQRRGLFELAKNGTLFLDEIGEMDIKLQSRLLRVLQEKTFRRVGGTVDITTDVRIVAATNQNLQRYISDGKFREDLYHRLARVVIDVPALRDRKEDIVSMAKMFFERAFQNRGKNFEGMTPAAESAITEYHWPGNVRELLNFVERAALLAGKPGKVDVTDLSLPKVKDSHITRTSSAAETFEPGLTIDTHSIIQSASNDTNGAMNYTQLKKKWSDAFEKEYLVSCLSRSQGNVTSAARESGIDRSNFLRLLRRHQINAQNYREMKKAA
jgi:transcriptional regulator with GAF, ATPase, and Fis domain